VPRSDGRIVRFLAVGPAGEQAVPGLDGYEPAGFLRPARAGRYAVLYESAPSLATLDAETVRAYLLEEGLTPPASARGEGAGPAEGPVHELFRRSLKALIDVGGAVPAVAPETFEPDTPAGLPLELVLERVGPAVPGERAEARDVSLRLLHEGAPLGGALVELRELGDREQRARAHTDDEGRVRLGLEPGRWVATTVHLDAAHSALGEWASVWAALSFELH
jgi:hypothetical protein